MSLSKFIRPSGAQLSSALVLRLLLAVLLIVFAGISCAECVEGRRGGNDDFITYPDGGFNKFVAPNPAFGNISIIDPSSGSIKNYSAGPRPVRANFFRDQKYAFTADRNGEVRRINLDTENIDIILPLEGYLRFEPGANENLIIASSQTHQALFNILTGEFHQNFGLTYHGNYQDSTFSLFTSSAAVYFYDNRNGSEICRQFTMIPPVVTDGKLIYYYERIAGSGAELYSYDLERDPMPASCALGQKISSANIIGSIKVSEDGEKISFISENDIGRQFLIYLDLSDSESDWNTLLDFPYPPESTAAHNNTKFKTRDWYNNPDLTNVLLVDRFGEGAYFINPVDREVITFSPGRIPLYHPPFTTSIGTRENDLSNYYTRFEEYRPHSLLTSKSGLAVFSSVFAPEFGFSDASDFALRVYQPDYDSSTADDLLYPDGQTAHSSSLTIHETLPPSDRVALLDDPDENGVGYYFFEDKTYYRDRLSASQDLALIQFMELLDLETLDRRTYRAVKNPARVDAITQRDEIVYLVDDQAGTFTPAGTTRRPLRLDSEEGPGIYLFFGVTGIEYDPEISGSSIGITGKDMCEDQPGAKSRAAIANLGTGEFGQFGCQLTGYYTDPMGKYVILTDYQLNRIYLVDRQTGEITKIKSAIKPNSVVFTDNGAWALAVHANPIGAYTIISLSDLSHKTIFAPGAWGEIE